MNRRDLLALAWGGSVGLPGRVQAQQPSTIPLIGILLGASPTAEALKLHTFLEALEQLGYVNGRTIRIEMRFAEGRPERFDVLARELVALAPAVIACVGRIETAALQAATRTIPIVFFQAANPVEFGFVASLARPGGNTTGFTLMAAELDAKRLELLHEIAPSVSRAAFLINGGFRQSLPERLAAADTAAQSFFIALRHLSATTSAELTTVLDTVDGDGIKALLIQNDALFATERSRILEFAVAHQLPTIFEEEGAVAQGGLLSYGADGSNNSRLAAGYVDKILKGAKPADLPVQRPTRFRLVINLKTAKALSLTIPPLVLARADEVIE